jgi:hypothetical protein
VETSDVPEIKDARSASHPRDCGIIRSVRGIVRNQLDGDAVQDGESEQRQLVDPLIHKPELADVLGEGVLVVGKVGVCDKVWAEGVTVVADEVGNLPAHVEVQVVLGRGGEGLELGLFADAWKVTKELQEEGLVLVPQGDQEGPNAAVPLPIVVSELSAQLNAKNLEAFGCGFSLGRESG